MPAARHSSPTAPLSPAAKRFLAVAAPLASSASSSTSSSAPSSIPPLPPPSPYVLRQRLARARHAAWCHATPPRLRDPLTGAGLLSGTVALLPVRDHDLTRPDSLRAPIPYATCQRETDNGGGGSHPARRNKYALGGARWTPRFAAYIGDAQTVEGSLAQQVENRYTCEDWYHVAYLVPKVRVQFGEMVTDALLQILADKRSRAEVAEEICRTVRWLTKQERAVAQWVKRTYGLGGRVGPLDGGHAYAWDCPCASCRRERGRDVARFATEGEGAAHYEGSSLYENTTVA